MAGWLATQGARHNDGSVSIERTIKDQLGLDQAGRDIAPAPDFTAQQQEQEIQEALEAQATAEATTQPANAQDWTVSENTAVFDEDAQIIDEPEATEATDPAAIETEDSFAQEIKDAAAVSDMDAVDDLGAVNLQNSDEVLALLESNPDALAAQLNAIEPGTAPAPAQINLAEQQAASAPVARTPAPPIDAPKKAAKPLTSAKPDSKLPEAISAIEAQAFKGVPEAQHDLAAIYTAGHGGAPQSYEKAAFWFRQAADQGVANARYNLGVLYHQGLGVEQDTAEAIRWYQAAADLKHPEAQYNLGIAYIEGIGVPYDPVKASDFFEAAAQAGVMEAAYNLGLIYENGLLGQAKPDVALKWYKAAADNGSPEAKAALEELAKTLNISLQDVNSVVEDMGGTPKAAATSAPAPVVAKKEKVSTVNVPVAAPPVTTKPIAVAEAVPGTSARDLAARNNDQMVIAQVQEYLMRIGLYPGPADGMKGPLTEDAIRSYQALNNMDADGIATQDLLTHMLANNAGNENDPFEELN